MAKKSEKKDDYMRLLDTYQMLSDKADAGTIQPPEVEKLKDIKKLLHDESQKIIDSKTLYDELVELEPFIEEELQKKNTSFLQYFENYTFGELLELQKDPESEFSKLLELARKTKLLNEYLTPQQAGRAARLDSRKKAEEVNAIMSMGNYTIFSSNELWNAFAPGRIVKMGTLDRNFINEETGEVIKQNSTDDLIKTGEFEEPKALDIPYRTFMLITTIMQNSVGDVKKELIQDGKITFYVKGIIEKFAADPRGLISEELKEDLQSQQLTLDRKTAGVLYLEDQFKPLQELIGITPNGSRYSVFNYVGYDAETDTMTITSPYIYQLWKTTQELYFKRRRNLTTAKNNTSKAPEKDDIKPLEINYLFKGATYHEDPITLEIAVYITNTILLAGYKGKPKTTEINYTTLINKCPRLRERLADIESKRGTLTDTGKPVNVTALYNLEFKKIKRAFDLIQDPDKCDFLKEYKIIKLEPEKEEKDKKKTKKNYIEFLPPTKSLIDGKMIIRWKKKKDD